jgi:hypothetical protein
MKTDNRLSRRIPASGVHEQKQPQWWLAPLLPFLTYINMRTLALLMFLGVALLNTTDGKDAQTNKPAAITTNMETVDNGHRTTSEARTEPTGQTISAALALWQFTDRIVHALTAALNDPSLIEYAKQQGTDIPDLQTTPRKDAEGKRSTY